MLIGLALFALLCIGGVARDQEKQRAARAMIEMNERAKKAEKESRNAR